MARIRTIKPEFWKHPVMARLPDDIQLLAIALLAMADDHGYFHADPAMVRGEVMPFREDLARISRGLAKLSEVGWIEVWAHPEQGDIGVVVKWADHQKVDHPKDSKLRRYDIRESFAKVSRERREVVALDQGTGNRDQGAGKGAESAPAQDDQDDLLTAIGAPPSGIPGQQRSDADRWRYEIGQTPWAQAIKRAGGKIGTDSWPVWESLMERIGGLESTLAALASLPATERWPDRVEEASGVGPMPTQDDEAVAKELRALVADRVGGDVFCKSVDLLKAAKIYGFDQVLALADHAAQFGEGLGKDLARFWFCGRESQYGGWDGYHPKELLDVPLTTKQVQQAISDQGLGAA
jgi:hypothetical protein